MENGILREFKRAAMQISFDLEIDSEIHYDLDDSELGFDFSANAAKSYRHFDFWLHEEKKETGSQWKAYLSIDYQEGASSFHFQENIDYIFGHSSFLCRWAAWAVFNFNREHNKPNLESIFNGSIIRVYGFPGYSDPGETEAKLLFYGIFNLQTTKVLLYKFRHVEPPSGYLIRYFSYAIWVNADDGHPFWVFFPDIGSLDSGRAFRTYKEIEKLIEMLTRKLKVEIRRVDIEYELLEAFLSKYQECFSSSVIEERTDQFFDDEMPSNLGEQLRIPFENLKHRFQNKEYPEALRDMRALVQQAEENLAKVEGIDYSDMKEPNINKLAALLCEKKIIGGQLIPWFNAFTSIANLAAHRIFPTKEDMKNDVDRDRIMLTFRLGFQLLKEIGN